MSAFLQSGLFRTRKYADNKVSFRPRAVIEQCPARVVCQESSETLASDFLLPRSRAKPHRTATLLALRSAGGIQVPRLELVISILIQRHHHVEKKYSPARLFSVRKINTGNNLLPNPGVSHRFGLKGHLRVQSCLQRSRPGFSITVLNLQADV